MDPVLKDQPANIRESKLYEGFVEHKRALPTEHAFRYYLYFYAIDLDELDLLDRDLPLFGHNRIRFASIMDADYLDEGKESIKEKVRNRLSNEPFAKDIAKIVLITSARYFNYVFNPVSFYYLYGTRNALLGVLAEVNNTFGEKHLYVLSTAGDAKEAYPARFATQKVFHVSPFNSLDGNYRFTFSAIGDEIDISIELVRDESVVFQGRLCGKALALTAKNHARLLLRHPLVAHLTMPRILYEAARLFFLRKLAYIDKPPSVHMMTLKRRSPNFLQRLSRRMIERLFSRISKGELIVSLPDGKEARFGKPGGEPSARMTIYDHRFFPRVLTGGDVGLGEAFTAGWWDTDDVPLLFSVLISNRQELADGYPVSAWLARKKNKIAHALRANTPWGSRRNISEHYDLRNEFFMHFLDPTMMYSCGIYKDEADTCEDAQRRKIAALIEKAGIGPDDSVLEIGCGWGGFAIEAVKQTGCRVTGITISEEQYRLAQERVRKEGLEDRITILLQDYRHIEGVFDKIISIEMLEAVGHKYLGAYFAACDRALKPGGKAAIQVITIPDQRYDEYRRETDWIQKYIFPGGHLPSVTALLQAATKSSSLLIVRLEDIGPYYARTLKDWREQFIKQHDRIAQMGFDESFRRKWIYYLAMCEAGFANLVLGNIQVVFRKPL
jgi:cyclopropane-fatty-acyl-phospholipid synthase